MDAQKILISEQEGFVVYKLKLPNLTLYVLEYNGIRYIRRNKDNIDAIIRQLKDK